MTKIPNLVSPFSKGGKGDFLEFGYCLLFAVWCLEFYQSWIRLFMISITIFFYGAQTCFAQWEKDGYIIRN